MVIFILGGCFCSWCAVEVAIFGVLFSIIILNILRERWMSRIWRKVEDLLWRVMKQVVVALLSIVTLSCIWLTGVIGYEFYRESSDKKTMKEYLANEYPVGTFVEVSRGFYEGCVGEIVGFIGYQAQIDLIDCKGDESNLVVLHARYFDDKAYDFTLKYPFFLSDILD